MDIVEELPQRKLVSRKGSGHRRDNILNPL